MSKSGAYGLLGNGGQADETEEFSRPELLRFRAVSAEYLTPGQVDLIDIATDDPELLAVPVTAAVGAPSLRRDLVNLWAGRNYRTIISDSGWISSSAEIGAGTVLAPQCAVSVGVVLGEHVLLNIGSSVSHSTVLGDFVTLSPGARVAGNCVLGDGVFLGIGAVVSNGVKIASGAVIGAGTVVLRDIEIPGVYVGSPARELRTLKEWIRAI